MQMIMIQDDPMPTGADKPLRITGDPHKVQVGLKRAQCVLLSFSLHSILHILCLQSSTQTFENLFVPIERVSARLLL